MKKILCIVLCLFVWTYHFAQEKLDINRSKSEIKWSGEYSFYFGGHNGTINFKEGYFTKNNDVITGGTFIIDMNSIICLDIKDEEANIGLVDHLKNQDFFNTSDYPTSILTILKVKYHDNHNIQIFADLTIKGITLPINFQAKVNYEKQQLTARFKIDRQRWGIDYNSTLRDGAIADGIGFEVSLCL